MLRFNPNWFARILRNSEPEVHVTVIESPPSDSGEVAPTAAAAAVSMAVQDAAQIASLAASMSTSDPELLRRLESLESGQRFITEQLGQLVTKAGIIETNTATLVVAEIAEEVEEEISPIAEVPIEVIPQTTPAPTEEPAPRKKSRWL